MYQHAPKVMLIAISILIKSHLLRCSRKSKNYEIEKRLTAGLQQKYWSCKWGSCTSGQIDYAEENAGHYAEHIEDHINKQVDNSNGQGVQCPYPSYISRLDYIAKVIRLLKRSRGWELPGTFDPLIVGQLFHEQREPWAKLVN